MDFEVAYINVKLSLAMVSQINLDAQLIIIIIIETPGKTVDFNSENCINANDVDRRNCRHHLKERFILNYNLVAVATIKSFVHLTVKR